MAIKVDLVADASKAIAESGKLGDALDKVADELEDVGKAGKTVDSEVSDAFRDMGKDAKKAGADIDGSVSDSLRGLGKDAARAGKDVGDGVRSGTDRAAAATDDFKKEAKANLSESVSSFRGDIEDIPQLLQDVLGGVSADLGALGAGVAVVGAAAVGLTIAALQGQAEAINAAKQETLDLASEIVDLGGDLSRVDFTKRMQDWGLAIQDTKEFWELWQAEAKSGFDVVQEQARGAGRSWTESFRGTHGTMADSIKFLADTEAEFSRLSAASADYSDVNALTGAAVATVTAEETTRVDNLGKLREAAAENARVQRDANRAASDAILLGKTQNDVVREMIELDNSLVDSRSGAITSELDLIDAVEKTKTSLAGANETFRDGTQASRDLEREIIGNADAMTEWAQKQVDAGQAVDVVNPKLEAYKNNLIDQATKFFGSRDAAAAYVEGLLKTPAKVSTDVNLNGIPDAEEKLRNLIRPGRHINVDVRTGDVSAVDNYIYGLNGRKVYVDIAPRGGVGITN